MLLASCSPANVESEELRLVFSETKELESVRLVTGVRQMKLLVLMFDMSAFCGLLD